MVAKKKAKKAKAKTKKKVVKQKCQHYSGVPNPTTVNLLRWQRSTQEQYDEDHTTMCTVCKKTWHTHASIYWCEYCCKKMGEPVGFPSSLD